MPRRGPGLDSVPALFLRALAVVYLIAFVSFGVQASGLVGSRGILPIADFLRTARGSYGARAFWYFPGVFWISSADWFIALVWVAGAACSLVLFFGFARRPVLLVLWALYLSVCVAGQDFFSFQWDVLLIEAGFLAIFLDDSLPRIWLFRWLVFRLIFMSGAVKLLSGDVAWRSLTAMEWHYETQPLPTPVAWYMRQLPDWFQRASTGFVIVAELLVPLLIFGPRRLRLLAAWITIGLQCLILITGNYTFFNILSIALCMMLFAEARVCRFPPRDALLVVPIVLVSGLELVQMFAGRVPFPAGQLLELASPLRTVNPYGLFAVMTTTRPEIIVQGSNDGTAWQDYEFRYKPGDLRRTPPIVEPHQPRLDWQMWFAALGNYQQNPWFESFLLRLLEGSPPVLRLLARNPFPQAPPRYIRAVVYEYRFTTWAERRASGDWWKREYKGIYFPASSRSPARR